MDLENAFTHNSSQRNLMGLELVGRQFGVLRFLFFCAFTILFLHFLSQSA
jgi:hypothetical protein